MIAEAITFDRDTVIAIALIVLLGALGVVATIIVIIHAVVTSISRREGSEPPSGWAAVVGTAVAFTITVVGTPIVSEQHFGLVLLPMLAGVLAGAAVVIGAWKLRGSPQPRGGMGGPSRGSPWTR
jgi:hypothetical protein